MDQLDDQAEQISQAQPAPKSVYSYKSSRLSQKSKVSMKSRIQEEKERESKRNAEWDRSTVASESKKPTLEDKMASKIASEVLKDNQKLKGVHSN